MATGPSRILIVEARFYDDIADQLVAGVAAELEAAGYGYDRVAVPGVFEVPAAIATIMRGKNGAGYAGAIALGCVIRGETDHYDHICRESSRALMDLACRDGVPLGFGILTCENRAQAEERADVARKNKGLDAAHACLRMIELRRAAGSAG